MVSDSVRNLLLETVDMEELSKLSNLTVYSTEELLILNKLPDDIGDVFVIGTPIRNRLLKKKFTNEDILKRYIFIETSQITILFDYLSNDNIHNKEPEEVEEKLDVVVNETTKNIVCKNYESSEIVVEDKNKDVIDIQEPEMVSAVIESSSIPKMIIRYFERDQRNIFELKNSNPSFTLEELQERVHIYFNKK